MLSQQPCSLKAIIPSNHHFFVDESHNTAFQLFSYLSAALFSEIIGKQLVADKRKLNRALGLHGRSVANVLGHEPDHVEHGFGGFQAVQ